MTRRFQSLMPGLKWLAGFGGALAGCGENPPEVQVKQEVLLNVRTIDLGGHPVESVRFDINGKKFGITDQDGSFQGRYPAKNGETLTFNVQAPAGYSVPPSVDQSRWQLQVNYPEGRPLQVEFTATLQRPEREYLLMVRTGSPASPVQVNNKLVGKTGLSGEALLKVTGIPGTSFNARASSATSGNITYKGVFAEEDEIYLITAERQGPLMGRDAPANPAAGAAVEPAAPEPANAIAEKPEPVPQNQEEPKPAPQVAAEPIKPAPQVAVEPIKPAPQVAVEPIKPAVAKTETSKPAAPAQNARNSAARDDTPKVASAGNASGGTSSKTAPTVRVESPAPATSTVRVGNSPARGQASSTPVVVVSTPATPPAVAHSRPEPVPQAATRADDIIVSDPPKSRDPEPTPVAVKASDEIANDSPRGKSGVEIPADKPAGNARVANEEDAIDVNAVSRQSPAAAGRSASAASMNREEVAARLSQMAQKQANHQSLSADELDFLNQIDRTSPSYGEANRLLAEHYYESKDYSRQIQALENATSSGPLKRDPQVLLSLAKAYAHSKNYRKALKTMQRVDENARRLSPDRKADAMRFHAEILEFEFLRQYEEDPKGANLGLIDKALEKWERYKTFATGADAAGVSKATEKISELTQLKRRMEL